MHSRNSDNLCLVRTALVAFSSACKMSTDKYKKAKALHPTLSTAEILIQLQKFPTWYYRHIRKNTRRKQNNLTSLGCHSLGIVDDQPLSYAVITSLEDYLYVNIYVVSSALGNKFSHVSQDSDQERKTIFLYHVERESEHFHAIVTISGFFASSYFCTSCLKPYEHKERHCCTNHCNVCLSNNCLS